MVVSRTSVACEIVSNNSRVVNIRHIVVADLISVPKKYMHSVVVLQELTQSPGIRIDSFSVLVDPMV